VYAVELAAMRGEWESATVDAELACRELTAHDPRYAGAAYYLVGELRRRTGARGEARAAFARAHQLGTDPQPGHALLDADEGRTDDALAALVNALRPGPGAPLPRARLLTAVVEVADRSDDRATIDAAVAELAELAAEHGGDVLEAAAAAARGRRLLTTDDAAAIVELRRAVDTYVRLGLPYDAARCRVDVARAAAATGDVGTARLELGTARAAFDRLGAGADADDAGHRLRGLETTADPGPDAPVLTGRELDVLRLVAEGRTNRTIATELFLSPHTVARHVSNVLTKLGVHSRAAAVATAVERGWLDAGR
jgi:DNA-binding NarL/FixJ family response regulator